MFDDFEFNPLHLAFSVLAGLIALMVIKFSGMEVNIIIKIIAPILSAIVAYIYLEATGG